MNKKRVEALKQTLIRLRDMPEREVPKELQVDLGVVCDAFQGDCKTHMCLAGWYVHDHPRGPLTLDTVCGGILPKVDKSGKWCGEFDLLADHFDLPPSVIESLFSIPSSLSYEKRRYDLRARKFWARRALKQLEMVEKWTETKLTAKMPELPEVDSLADKMYNCLLKKAPTV